MPTKYFSLEQLDMLNEQSDGEVEMGAPAPSTDPKDVLGYAQTHYASIAHSPLARAGFNPNLHIYTDAKGGSVLGSVTSENANRVKLANEEKEYIAAKLFSKYKDPMKQAEYFIDSNKQVINHINKNYKDRESREFMYDNAVQFSELVRKPLDDFVNPLTAEAVKNRNVVAHESIHQGLKYLRQANLTSKGTKPDEEHMLINLWMLKYGNEGEKAKAEKLLKSKNFESYSDDDKEAMVFKLERLEQAASRLFPYAAAKGPIHLLKETQKQVNFGKITRVSNEQDKEKSNKPTKRDLPYYPKTDKTKRIDPNFIHPEGYDVPKKVKF